MAYIDFREAELSGVPLAALGAATRAPIAVSFSATEWLVIALARHDSVRSLRSPGRIARLGARLFGWRTESPLADARLEALRRLSVFAWRDSFNVPQSELAAFHDAGFSTDHAEMLLEAVLAARGRAGHKAGGAARDLVRCGMVGQTAAA